MPRLIYTAQERYQMRVEYESGMTLNQLSKKYGGHATSISRAIVREGGQLRDRGGVYPKGFKPEKKVGWGLLGWLNS